MRNVSLLFFLCAALLTSGCDESLPPYEEPNRVFSIDMSVSPPPNISYTYRPYLEDVRSGFPILEGMTGSDFTITIVNTYEETFQGPFDNVQGRIDVWLADYPNLSYRIQNIPHHTWPKFLYVKSTLLLDPAQTTLTINPNQQLLIGSSYYYRVSGGDYLFNVLPPIATTISPGAIYNDFGRVHFKARATIQVFPKSAPVVSPDIDFYISISGFTITSP